MTVITLDHSLVLVKQTLLHGTCSQDAFLSPFSGLYPELPQQLGI